jgi:hypothetical protein
MLCRVFFIISIYITIMYYNLDLQIQLLLLFHFYLVYCDTFYFHHMHFS